MTHLSLELLRASQSEYEREIKGLQVTRLAKNRERTSLSFFMNQKQRFFNVLSYRLRFFTRQRPSS
jgi:hypothetical protein